MKDPRSRKSYHKLINSGGQGCIFEPAIPCYRKTRNRRDKTDKDRDRNRDRNRNRTAKNGPKRKDRTVSKVSFNSKSGAREISMNDLVRKIPNHDSWAILWSQFCETPAYRKLVKRSDIKKCLDKKHVPRGPGSHFPMLVGPFGGQTIYEMGQAKLKKSSFKTQGAFDAVLQKLLGTMEPLFEGLVSLHTHKICHGDLSVRNVLVKDNKSYMIDFGLAYRYSNKTYLKKRVSFMRTVDKTYDPYPYEYILYSSTHKQLQEERKDASNEDFREGHEDYVRFHEVVLGRTNANKELEDYLDQRIKDTGKGIGKGKGTGGKGIGKGIGTGGKGIGTGGKGGKGIGTGGKGIGKGRPSLTTLVQNLDTYSLGILIPTLLHDISLDLEISFKTLKTRCHESKHKEFFALCRDMTEFSSSDRLSVKDSLSKFRNHVR
jgi:hypothetical protein